MKRNVPAQRRIPATALLALALLLAGCGNWPPPAPITTPARPGPVASPVGTRAPRGGRVTIGVTGALTTLNPAFGATPLVATVTRPMVEGLVDFDDEGRPQPWLAEALPTVANGGVSADGTVVTWKLRQGVAWDDGQPFTAADVVFTLAAARDPANPFTGDFLAPLANIRVADALDPYTVRLTYTRPDATYLQAFSTIYPAHLFNGLTTLVGQPYNRGPVGTGPFRFREWAPGDHLTLERAPSYREPGRPYLAELVFRFFPDDAAATKALRQGAIDLLLDPAAGDFADLAATPGIVTADQPGNAVALLIANVASSPLAERELRRALALTLDRRALAGLVPGGLWRAAPGPLGGDPPENGVAVPEADPLGAARLLDRLGWTRGGAGLRHRDGRDLRLTLRVPADDPALLALAAAVQTELGANGIALAVEPAPLTTLLAPAGPARAGQFDLLLLALPHGPEPLPFLRATFGCSPPAPLLTVPEPGPENYGRWCDADAARALDAATGATTDAARGAAERDLLAVVAREAPVAPLAVAPRLLAFRATLRDLAPARWRPVTWNAAVWWRQPARGR